MHKKENTYEIILELKDYKIIRFMEHANNNPPKNVWVTTKNSQKIPKITTLSILFFYFKLIITIN
jgi:hypothetical protein